MTEPTLIGERLTPLSIKVHCPYCQREHVHNYTSDMEDGLSHRQAHCSDVYESKVGYEITLLPGELGGP